MNPEDGGVPSYQRYDEDDSRCPICFVPPRERHLDSCDYQGVWGGGEDDADGTPPPRAGGWTG